MQQTEYSIQDEDMYYEDKFGVMLSDQGRIAGNHSIHMGNQPLDGKPGPSGGRGLHYTTDGSIVDVWHWKSVRTGNAVMGQLDDNYFGAPMEPKEGKRYTGGYTKDPKDGGGYEMNWEKYADAGVVPKYLPSDPAQLAKFQNIDMSPDATDTVAMFLMKSEVVPYDPARDTYPVGTIMPAVIVDKAMQGDRGDVLGVSHWQDGMWTIEIKRKLDTGSEFDIPFALDRSTYLWVAAFNHAQTRHSRHLHPVEITLEN
ncbi:MAG: ethylbenzene dehydrogenase-related protein [Pseudomonadota bacterium]